MPRSCLILLLLLTTLGTGCLSAALPPPAAPPTLAATASLLLAQTAVAPPPPTHTPNPSPTASAAPPTATAVPSQTPSPTPVDPFAITPQPGAPQGYLSRFRLVAFYGSPLGPGLGIVGDQPRPETLRLLRERIADYAPFSPERPILPAYHLVVTVANPHPPYYRHHVETAVLQEWIDAAKADNVAVILDIQPGRTSAFHEYQRIREFLYEPHVHVAIDPEFAMNDQQIPGQQIGQLYASEINAIQADLDQIAQEIGLNRVLILHQFADKMLPNKAEIIDYPHVELLIDGDGVGSPGAKVRNYNRYAAEPGFEFGGFKLFPTDGDWPLMSPQEVMTELSPPPVLIIYQ